MISSIIKLTAKQYIKRLLIIAFLMLLFLTLCIALVTIALMHGYTALIANGVPAYVIWLSAIGFLILFFYVMKRDVRRAKIKQQLLVQKTINDYHHFTSDATRGVILAFLDGFKQPPTTTKPYDPTQTPSQPTKGDTHV